MSPRDEEEQRANIINTYLLSTWGDQPTESPSEMNDDHIHVVEHEHVLLHRRDQVLLLDGKSLLGSRISLGQ
jgi:hypothetical protein